MNWTWKLGIAAAFGLVLAGVAAAAPARIIYVDDAAAGANDGTSWTDAYTCLQDALYTPPASDPRRGHGGWAEPIEVRLAAGVYRPDQGVAVTPGDREASFVIFSEAVLLGGYAGVAAADPNTRNVECYRTILSGDLNGDDADVNDPRELADAPTRADNSFQVVTVEYAHACVLDGITIRAGQSPYDGGGLHVLVSELAVRNCTLSHNWGSRGGATSVIGSRRAPSGLAFSDCVFFANASEQYGGGLFITQASPSFNDCAFTANCSEHGGALASRDANVSLSNCTFRENLALEGGGLHVEGGSMQIVGCAFWANSALAPPPTRDIHGRGGALYASPSLNVDNAVTDCLFQGNTALYGGALSGSLPVLRRCRFTGNVAPHAGGTLHVLGLACEHCVFDGNKAPIGAAGLSQESVSLTNCTVVGNRSVDGDVFYTPGGHDSRASVDVSHCIVWDQPRGQDGARLWLPGASVNYSDIQGGWRGGWNTDVDPCFADPGLWDDNGTPDDPSDDVWVAGDYHLKSEAGRWDPATESWMRDDVTSRCIDAGDPAGPIADEPFPNGGIANVGAYGGTAEASKSYFGEPVCETIFAGDINGDCRVDFADFEILSHHWLEDRRAAAPTGGKAEP